MENREVDIEYTINGGGETLMLQLYRPGAFFPLKGFVERLLTGVVGLWSRIEQLVLESAYTKTILLLLYYAGKFGVPTDGAVSLELSPTHREIAAWIGTTRETASLQVEALKKKKLIRTRGRQLIIPSLPALEKELSSVRTPQK